ncbi:MAG: hypothetical protein AB7P20_15605 [Rhizobiaceae bacterium]
MDGRAAINFNHEALRRIVAGLVAMVQVATGRQFAMFARQGAAVSTSAENRFPALALPRHLYLAVLRLLRPAESAARRLIIAFAAHLPPVPVKALPVRPTRIAGAIVLRPAAQPGILVPLWARHGAPPAKKDSARLSLPLFDPLPRPFRRVNVVASSVPRISLPGITEVRALPPPKQPSAADPTDATHLGRRLAALAAALNDLPAQAERFARWQSRCLQNRNTTRRGRIYPLRGGRPPGGRLSRFDPVARRRRNIREVDEILAHAHALAVFALERRDTS